MDDVAIRLEHVHLLNGCDGLHVHLLENRLELLVIGAGALVDLLDLPSWCALASVIIYMSEATQTHVYAISRIVCCSGGHSMPCAETRPDRIIVEEELLTLHIGQSSSKSVQNARIHPRLEEHTNSH